tara:strand:+ start:165 stop:347 length:183 start_codon:yes stop_codon:yes gene_type:complete
MTSQEFSDWLDTCPTHKWEEVSIDDRYIRILFPIETEEEDEEEDEISAYQRNWMNENTND